MALTTQQLDERRNFIGSSDAAAIFGMDPFKSAHDVYLSKVMEVGQIEDNEAIDIGNRVESVLLQWAEEKIGRPLQRNVLVRKGIFGANLDAEVVGANEIVEAKSTGLSDEWGEPGTDQVPDRVIIQTHHAMYVKGAVIAWVPVLIGRFGLKLEMYRVERNEDVIEAVAKNGELFWNRHVLPRVPPSDSKPSLELLKRIRREPGKVVPIDAELVRAYLEARDAAKVAIELEEMKKAELIAALGDADAGQCEDGRVTYLEQSRKEHVVKASTFRVLRWKGIK